MQSVWIKRSFAATPDVVVIGAGLVGLFAALHVKRNEPRRSVLVLERGEHPDGASVRNAGFACFGSPSELLADMEAEGKATALARVEERWKGLQALRQELGDATIGFEASGGHELFGNDGLYTHVAERFDDLNTDLHAIFGRSVFEWCDHRKGDLGIRAEHLSFTPLEGAVDSGMLMRTLLRKAHSVGVEVRFGSPVESFDDTVNGVDMTLGNGLGIKAGQVIVATNGYTGALLPDLDVVPARGQVVLTEPVPGLKLRGTFHADEGFVYFRDLNGRVLLGGGRNIDLAGERTTDHAITENIQQHLEQLLRTVILPEQEVAIAQRWSGIMAFGAMAKTPLVERVSPHVVAAVRLGGMGVAIGIRVAARAAELLQEDRIDTFAQ